MPLDLDIVVKAGTFTLEAKANIRDGVTAVLGASGAGKTLLLRSIAGLTRISSGKINIGSELVESTPEKIRTPCHRRNIGYVSQEYAVFPHMSVRKNLYYGISTWPKFSAETKVSSLLELLDLVGLENRKAHQLSNGQLQRVALGRALAREPDLLLLDEPFSALDTPTRIELIEGFLILQRELGFNCLLVTHSIREAIKLATNLIVLHHGKILQMGTVKSVLDFPSCRTVARLLEQDV